MEDELPSVSLTMRFLALCDQYGSQRAVLGLVAAGRKVGVSGLSAHDDWPAWDADEMQAAVKHLEDVLPGVAKLVVQQRERRTGRNPATGAPVEIPAKQVVKARIAKQLRDVLEA